MSAFEFNSAWGILAQSEEMWVPSLLDNVLGSGPLGLLSFLVSIFCVIRMVCLFKPLSFRATCLLVGVPVFLALLPVWMHLGMIQSMALASGIGPGPKGYYYDATSARAILASGVIASALNLFFAFIRHRLAKLSG